MYATKKQNIKWMLRWFILIVGAVVLQPFVVWAFGSGSVIWILGAIYGVSGGLWAEKAYE